MASDGRSLGFEMPGSDIKRMGYLRKLKTMKKKYFVLRSTSSSGPARLEYYDSERKFCTGQAPKRNIHIHTCFNINKKSDSKHKYAIALYTKDDCFSIIADSQDEQDSWLEQLLKYQHEFMQEEDGYEHFEHVWQVTVQAKGLGISQNIRGNYRLCLSSQSINLVKINCVKPLYKFQLATVRSLAHSDCLFRMEVGSWAPTGKGELWMNVEDSVIAKSMHEAILNCMKAAVDMMCSDDMDRPSDQGTSERNRSGSMHHPDRPVIGPIRRNTFSDNRTHSPIRQKTLDRPMSSVYSTKSAVDAVSPGTSPGTQSCLLIPGSHRFRSDSEESRASRHSASMGQEYMMSANDMFGDYSSEQSEILEEEDGSETSSIPSTPTEVIEKLRLDYEEDQSHASPYMDMTPGNITPPTATTAPGGYVDMTLGAHPGYVDSGPACSEENNTSYMNMSPGAPPASEPIPIRAEPKSTGYMDMCPSSTSHSTPLPTVREGGSNEGYLPMSPSFTQNSIDTSSLRPMPTTCLLTDETGEFIKRTYSLGSKPPTKVPGKSTTTHDSIAIKKGSLDNGKSCSAPHLLHKGRNLSVDSTAPSVSPLSMSYKSDCSYRSDDSDSFMELDFHRPRTASDSYSCRPRASSFGKIYQGHRPRSSSYGQQAKQFKMKLGSKLGSYESVRMTSQELMHRASMDSISRGSRDSLRMSSNESLRKMSEDLRTKTNLLNTEYVDMNIEKHKASSPLPPGKASGYMDMTIGSRTTSPNRGKVKEDGLNTSHSDDKLQKGARSDHVDDVYMNMESSDIITGHSGHDHHGKSDDFRQHRDGAHPTQKSAEHSHSHHKDGYSSPHPVKTATVIHQTTESDYIGFEPGQIDHVSSKKGDKTDSKTSKKSHTQQGRSSESKKSSSASRVGSDNRKTDHHGRPVTVPEQESYVMYEPKDQYVMYEPQSLSMSHSDGQTFQQVSSDSVTRKSRDSSSKEGKKKSSRSKRSSKVMDSDKASPIEGGAKSSGAMSKKLPQKDVRSVRKEEVADEYIEFSPMNKSASETNRTQKSKMDRMKGKFNVSEESEYIGFEPGTVSSKESTKQPVAVKSMISLPPSEKKTGQNVMTVSSDKKIQSSQSSASSKAKKSSAAEESYFNFDFGKSRSSSSMKYSEARGCEPSDPFASFGNMSGNKTDSLQSGVRISQCSNVPISGFVLASGKNLGTNAKDNKGGGSKSVATSTRDSSGCNSKSVATSPREGCGDDSKSVLVSPKESGGVSPKGFVMSKNDSPGVTKGFVSQRDTPPSGSSKGVLISRENSAGSSKGVISRENSVGSSKGVLVSRENSVGSSKGVLVSRENSVGSSKGVHISRENSVGSSKGVLISSDNSGGSTKGVMMFSKDSSGVLVSSRDSSGSGKGVMVFPREPLGLGISKGAVISSRDVTLSSDSVRVKHSSGGSLKGVISKEGSVPLESRCKHGSGSSVSSDSLRSKHNSGGSAKGSVLSRDSSEVFDSSGTLNSSSGAMDSLEPGTSGLTRPGSTPCMLTLDEAEGKQNAGAMLTVDSNPRSRHSIADLSAYEKMSFSSNTLSTNQQQDSQKVLNYASLDLGSAEAVGDNDSSVRSPRVKSRHSSSNEERAEPPLSYASIDFEKSESLKNAGSKDVMFTL